MALQRDPRHAQFAERLLHQVQAYRTLKAPCFYLNPDNSLDAKTIKAGVKYSFIFRKHDTEIILYLDTSNRLPNKALFDHLAESREAIERRYREPLEWRRQDGTVEGVGNTRVSRVRKIVTRVGYLEERAWPRTQKAVLDAMQRLCTASIEYVATL